MAGDTEAYEVVGTSPIIGADGRPVVTGGTVRLDPNRTNVDALLAGGHIAKDAPKAKPATPAVVKVP